MRMRKPPFQFLNDAFEYHEYIGTNDWNEPLYSAPKVIEHAKIDRGSEYSSNSSGKQLLYNSIVYCYNGATVPFPDFREQSMIVFDGKEHIITKTVKNYEPYMSDVYSYELEVI